MSSGLVVKECPLQEPNSNPNHRLRVAWQRCSPARKLEHVFVETLVAPKAEQPILGLSTLLQETPKKIPHTCVALNPTKKRKRKQLDNPFACFLLSDQRTAASFSGHSSCGRTGLDSRVGRRVPSAPSREGSPSKAQLVMTSGVFTFSGGATPGPDLIGGGWYQSRLEEVASRSRYQIEGGAKVGSSNLVRRSWYQRVFFGGFCFVYVRRGTLPTKKGVEKGTTGGPSTLL